MPEGLGYTVFGLCLGVFGLGIVASGWWFVDWYMDRPKKSYPKFHSELLNDVEYKLRHDGDMTEAEIKSWRKMVDGIEWRDT